MYQRALAKPKEWGVFRRVVGMALVAFLLTGALTLPEVWAATYYVNSGTGNDGRTPGQAQSSSSPWKTLTHALGQVSSGDVVSVAPGTYDASNGESYPLELKDGVKIEGQNKATTILAPPARTPVFENIDTPLSSGTTLTGFTLKDQGSSNSSLIHLQPNTVIMNPTIDGNIFEGSNPTSSSGVGIQVDTDSYSAGPRTFNGTITNNTFDGFDDAIDVSADLEAAGSGTFSPTIAGNTFTNNDEGVEVSIGDSAYTGGDGLNLTSSPKITGNSGNGNYHDIYIYADMESGNGTIAPLISGNSFTNSTDDSISLSLETLSAYQPNGLVTAAPVVTNNTITHPGGDGVEVFLSYAGRSYTTTTAGGSQNYPHKLGSTVADITVAGNTVTDSQEGGIALFLSEEYQPQGNQSKVTLTVANNTISNQADSGISISAYSLDNTFILGNSTVTIAGNNVEQTGSSGSTGIYDYWSFDGYGTGTLSQVVSGNTVTNGSEDPGILISDESVSSLESANVDIHDNVVTGRTNGNGIELYQYRWRGVSQVLASCNTTTNNYNGFVVDTSASSYSDSETPDLGGGYATSPINPGLNSFHDNSNDDLVANTDNISAQSNYWGSTHNIGGAYSGNVDDSNALGSAPSVSAVNSLTATAAGELITYTATLQMTGDCGCASTLFKAPTPPNTTVVPGSVVVNGATGAVVQSEDPLQVAVGAMGTGDTITVSWEVQATSGFSGDVSDQASLGCTQLGKNVTLSDDPSTQPAPDPTVVTLPAGIIQIPTLNGVGLALLFGLLFLAGLLLVRKKKSGVALLLALGLFAGLSMPARAGTSTTATRSKAAHQRLTSQRARSALHAAVLSEVVVQGRQVHLALSDGTALTVPRGRVHVARMKLAKAAKHAMSKQELRQWKRQQQRLRHVDALQSGQALVVKVVYARNGKIRHVLIRPAESLQSAKARVTKIEKSRALRAQKAAARSRAKATSTH